MKTVMERIWPRIDRNGPVPPHAPELGPCWLWTGGCSADGYGQISVRGASTPSGKTTLRVHRLVYENLVGPIPDGLQVDHLCRVRPCANPRHLELVICRVNVQRSRGLAAANLRKTHCGRGHPFTKENTYVDKRGSRHCRKCNLDAVRRYQRARAS